MKPRANNQRRAAKTRRTPAVRPSSQGLTGLLLALEAEQRTLTVAELKRALTQARITPNDVQAHVRFGIAKYRRNLVRRTADYEVLVLCWKPGQQSPIHDHSGSNCAVKVLSGAATEVKFDRTATGGLRVASAERLEAGGITASADADLHRVANWEGPGENLVTLHVYSPPLRGMQLYPDALVAPTPADREAAAPRYLAVERAVRVAAGMVC